MSNLLKAMVFRFKKQTFQNGECSDSCKFVKEYLAEYRNEEMEHKMSDDDRMDFRRLVFVSLNGLFNTWRSVPFHKLWTALVLVPLKREWIYYPSQYKNKLKTSYSLCQYIKENASDFVCRNIDTHFTVYRNGERSSVYAIATMEGFAAFIGIYFG